ncbi:MULTISPECIES: hypothetical protein [Kocuria]|uniref:hypothetical protein n=1 Tax=Kocuria TaxID=57493 RepID=UPI001643EE1C|nr:MULTISPECIES: hypothetical protein [Kocuria]MBS6030030.1 hypothetical protein [Kocuria rhizophila]
MTTVPAWWPVPPLPLVVVGPPDVAAFLGGVLEYHDFFGCATAASVVFSQIFFLACDATIALIPVLRDLRRGRPFPSPGRIRLRTPGREDRAQEHLVITLVLMGAAIFLIGMLPDFHSLATGRPRSSCGCA